MMVNHMDDNDDYGTITLDDTEPYAKKILDVFSHKETLDILDLTEKPSTICEICAKSKYSRSTIYRRISGLLDVCLLFTKRKQDKNFGRCGPWIYVKSVYSVSIKSGRMSCSCNCTGTLIEILPKREFYGQILKIIRNHRL